MAFQYKEKKLLEPVKMKTCEIQVDPRYVCAMNGTSATWQKLMTSELPPRLGRQLNGDTRSKSMPLWQPSNERYRTPNTKWFMKQTSHENIRLGVTEIQFDKCYDASRLSKDGGDGKTPGRITKNAELLKAHIKQVTLQKSRDSLSEDSSNSSSESFAKNERKEKTLRRKLSDESANSYKTSPELDKEKKKNDNQQRFYLDKEFHPHFSMNVSMTDADCYHGLTRCRATPEGTFSLTLREEVVVNFTLEGGVRITCGPTRCVVASNSNGTALAILHSIGRVFQDGKDVSVITHGPPYNKKYATFLFKGIRFTSDLSSMGYSLEASGLRPVFKRTCANMFQDFSYAVMFDRSSLGPNHISRVIQTLQTSKYWSNSSGNEKWIINGIVITQSPRGHVRVEREDKGFELSVSPTNGTVFTNNRFAHCTADNCSKPHLFVKQENRRVYYDANADLFQIRLGGLGAEMKHDGSTVSVKSNK